MGNATTLTYGGVAISPVPFFNITKEYNKAGDGRIIGSVFSIRLQGTVTPVSTGTEVNITSVIGLQNDIRDIFAKDGHQLLLQCGSDTLINAYPRINGVSFNPESSNWVQKAPYTIDLEFDNDLNLDEDSDKTPPFVSSTSESWQVEFANEDNYHQWSVNGVTDTLPYTLRITHNVGAVGKTHYDANGSSGDLNRLAWQQAREYVVPLLGYDANQVECTGVLNLDSSLISAFNHQRICNTDELGGSFNVTETWIGVPTGIAGVVDGGLEDFNINVRTSQGDGLTHVNIDGSILGLEERTFGATADSFSVTRSKFEAASGYFGEVRDRFYYRASEALEQIVASGDHSAASLNPDPVETNVGWNPAAGSVSYSYSYNNRACNFLDAAIVENISIVDNHPTNSIASLVVLGRANGPILQDLGTVTAGSRTMSYDAVVAPTAGCTDVATLYAAKPVVTGIICDIESNLVTAYTQVFKQSDSESWDIKTGRYSRSVSWTFANCDGVGPTTTFC